MQSKQASPSPSNTSTSENNTNTLSPSSFGYILNINFEDFNQPKRKVVQKLKDSRPFISLGFTADLAPHDNNNNTDYYDDKMTNNITGKTEEGPGNPIINFTTPSSQQITFHHLLQTIYTRQQVISTARNLRILLPFKLSRTYQVAQSDIWWGMIYRQRRNKKTI